MKSTWQYIEDEMDARGWTREELAQRMALPMGVEYTLIAFRFMEAAVCHVADGEFTAGLARAFGTSSELWANIDEEFRAYLGK